MSKVISATAPCSFGVWYPDGSPAGTGYISFLDYTSQAGYKTIELGPVGYLPTDTAELEQELSKRNLSVCAGTICYAFDQYTCFADFKDNIDDLCKRLVAFGAKYIVTMDESDVGMYSEKKQHFTKEMYHKFFDMFKEMGAYTQSVYGIETIFHPHVKSIVETEQEIYDLMAYTGLNLCFDIGHHTLANGEARANDTTALDFLVKNKDRIVYLHFKNLDLDLFKKIKAENLDTDTAFDIGVMGKLDEGVVSYEKLKQILDDINFTGIGVIEQDVPKATPQAAFELAQHNLKYLTQIGIVG